ncbi:hypothetical protein TNCT_141731 [Trichonephila clavata]|uniref:Uncharacterized protein n=1 Tax=Trichonephila clavata TaxID=2740835 RepID=A0A8X6J7K3_TRICU|nr:hypothetical protein TNCT_141731 [Trichonephila clavata]
MYLYFHLSSSFKASTDDGTKEEGGKLHDLRRDTMHDLFKRTFQRTNKLSKESRFRIPNVNQSLGMTFRMNGTIWVEQKGINIDDF